MGLSAYNLPSLLHNSYLVCVLFEKVQGWGSLYIYLYFIISLPCLMFFSSFKRRFTSWSRNWNNPLILKCTSQCICNGKPNIGHSGLVWLVQTNSMKETSLTPRPSERFFVRRGEHTQGIEMASCRSVLRHSTIFWWWLRTLCRWVLTLY